MDFLKFQRHFLFPYLEDLSTHENGVQDILCMVSIGSYVEALQHKECQEIFSSVGPYENEKSLLEHLKNIFDSYISNNPDNEITLFCFGIACLQLFTQNNFCGPMTGPKLLDIFPCLLSGSLSEQQFYSEAAKELVLDTEGPYNLLFGPEYLLIARVIFSELKPKFHCCESIEWWFIRYSFIHQKVLDEHSQVIYESVIESIPIIEDKNVIFDDSCKNDLLALFYLEICQFYLYYHDITNGRSYFSKAKNTLQLEIQLSGALGKRTRWQQNDIAQLVVKISYINKSLTENATPGPTLLPSDLPKDVYLTDDTRLHKINFQDCDEDIIPELKSIEQMLLFVNLVLLRKSCAHDVQLDEETKAFLWALLQYPKNWIIHASSLFLRSQIEVGEPRAMERAMSQLEEIVNAVNREEPSRFERLKLIYSSSFLPHWNIQQELARVFVRLGCIKTALEVFERLHLWEDVIICYNELQMRQRSADIIRNLIEKKESPKLWCLLGDATDDISYYQKAWELSNFKSARAQRSLGNYYYVRKSYKEAINHYENSLKLNSLQFPVWLRLGYCALQAEEWEVCAAAYRRCSVLEPDSFECWNNMSQAYLKLGQLHRAWKSLEEATRCNTTSWRLWDNYMLVSTSIGYTSQALNAYYKILSLKERHIDTDILGRIVYAVLENKTDPDGREMRGLYKKCTELLAKLTREVPTNSELWYLYGEMVGGSPEPSQETKHIAMQHYRKSVATATQKTGWERDYKTSCDVVMRSLRLLESAEEVFKEEHAKAVISELASLRMLIRGTIKCVKRGQTNINTDKIDEKIKEPLMRLEDGLEKINNFIADLNKK